MADIVIDGMVVYGADKVAFEKADGSGEQEFIIPQLQAKSVAPSASQQVVTPDSGKDGLSSVTVSAIQLQAKSVTPSGSQQVITPDSGKNGLSSVTVGAVQLQAKSVSANGTVAPDSGYYGLSSVAVNVPSDAGEPIECATDAEMTAALTAANVGKVVHFTGTTGTYTNGEYYLVEASV